MTSLILASQSPARRQLLERLALPFSVHAADIDETPLANETAVALVQRLAVAKAQRVAEHYSEGLIIGADEVGALDAIILSKPGDHAHAVAQLTMMSGQTVEFLTGLCLLNVVTGRIQQCLQRFSVVFRSFDGATIENYLQKTQPYGCAGSFQAEGIGMALCERSFGDDPSSLIGLPMLRLVDFLAQEGINIL